MGTSRRFSDFMRELEAEARREGPDAVTEAESFRAYFQLAREFVKRRQARGLTQRELAKKAGVQQSEISRIEQGNANPTFQTIYALARALGAEFHLIEAGSRRAPRPSANSAARHLSARHASAKRGR